MLISVFLFCLFLACYVRCSNVKSAPEVFARKILMYHYKTQLPFTHLLDKVIILEICTYCDLQKQQ